MKKPYYLTQAERNEQEEAKEFLHGNVCAIICSQKNDVAYEAYYLLTRHAANLLRLNLLRIERQDADKEDDSEE